MSEDVEFWSCDDEADYLSATTPEEAVDEWSGDLEPIPDEIVVYGYAPVKGPSVDAIADFILERTLEWLDENCTSTFSDDYTDPTPEMEKAAMQFAKVVKDEYVINLYECVTEKTISTKGIIGGGDVGVY